MTVKYDEIKRLFGDINDHMVVEIQSSGATMVELEEVLAHLSQQTDVMGELERPLTGRALRLYDLLRQRDDDWTIER